MITETFKKLLEIHDELMKILEAIDSMIVEIHLLGFSQIEEYPSKLLDNVQFMEKMMLSALSDLNK